MNSYIYIYHMKSSAWLGGVKLALGDFEAAKELCEDALRWEPGSWEPGSEGELWVEVARPS